MSKTSLPFISVIMPTRNEERYIAPCLHSLLQSSLPRDRWEIVIADGMSEDRTRDEVWKIARTSPVPITLLDNERRITPVALNLALARARGEIIIRVDAHAEYSGDYLARCVAVMRETGAECVGGLLETRPGAETRIACAIALVMTHPFGVGNSAFRTGVGTREADTVPFGCYRREVFQRIGLFDERLVRRQDYDLNQRIIHTGGRVILDPRIRSAYYARATLRGMAAKAWSTGYWNAISQPLHRYSRCLRHTLPGVFVLAAGVALLFGAWRATLPFPSWAYLPAIPLWTAMALYCVLLLAVSARLAARRGWSLWPVLLVVFPVLHFSYGGGFLRGWVCEKLRRYPWDPNDRIPTWDEVREPTERPLAA